MRAAAWPVEGVNTVAEREPPPHTCSAGAEANWPGLRRDSRPDLRDTESNGQKESEVC